MKDYYLAHPANPEQVHGPYTIPVILEWMDTEPTAQEAYLWDGEWKLIRDFLETLPPPLLIPNFGGTVGEEDDEEVLPHWRKATKLRTKKALQKSIRDLLDQLWEAHRELFFTRDVYNELPDDRHDQTWTEAGQIKEEILLRVEEYCAATGIIDQWIHALITDPAKGATGVYKIALPHPGDYREKYFFVEDWLKKANILDKPGCYCFMKEKTVEDDQTYLYIGKAKHLRDRLHRYYDCKGLFWQEATHLKLYLPVMENLHELEQTHRLSELERLLIVRHWQTGYNQKKEEPGEDHDAETLSRLDQVLRQMKERMEFFFTVAQKTNPQGEFEFQKKRSGRKSIIKLTTASQNEEEEDAREKA